MTFLSIAFIILGLIILGFGTRLALLGAGVGALLGIGFLRLLPGTQESWLWWLIPIGLAVLFAVGAGIAKGLVSLVALAFGALAGGTIVLALLDLFGLDWGLTNWLLALLGAVVGAALMSRFKKWGMIILASLVGAFLCMRGLQIIFPSFDGFIASLVSLALVVAGIAYQGGLFGKKK